jgi:putative peptidoglycan binding protein
MRLVIVPDCHEAAKGVRIVRTSCDALDSAQTATIVASNRDLLDRCFASVLYLLGRRIMAGSISPWPVVKGGDNGNPIKTLQYLLRAHGHNIAVDGVFGAITEAAVKAFQARQGQATDGIVAPVTWAALVVEVKMGSRGDAVKGVQEEFQFRNLSGDPSKGPQIDGIFGPLTEASVRGFQQALSLDIPSVVVDGIVGPVTWQALVSGMLSF